MIAQCLLFASFPAKYQDNSGWYAFVLFITPALGFIWWWITGSEEHIGHLICIWFAYVWLGLVPMVGIVFGLTAEELDRNHQLDPNVLKICVGITPLPLLLLLDSAALPRYRKELTELSVMMTVDAFDGNELLRMVNDESVENTEGQIGIPRGLVRALLSFACIAFLLSPLEMVGMLFVDEEGEEEEDGDHKICCHSASMA